MAATPAEERTIKNLCLDKFPLKERLGCSGTLNLIHLGVMVSLPQTLLNDDRSRRCLLTISSTFDALGMFGPVLLPAKEVMQKTLNSKLH